MSITASAGGDLSVDFPCLMKRVKQHSEEFVEELKEAIRIPSVSSCPDMRSHCLRMVDWTKRKLEELEFAVTEENLSEDPDEDPIPVLLAELSDDHCKTVLCVYGYLDVHNVEEDEDWMSPPFEALVIEKTIIGRGASSNKASFLTWIDAVRTFKAQNIPLPVNLKMVLECGGTIESPGLENLIERMKNSFFADVDLLVVTDLTWLGNQAPNVIFGGKGVINFSVEMAAVRSGCVDAELSSELDVDMMNEAMSDVVHLLNGLSDVEGNVLIPDIDDVVPPVTEEEIRHYNKLDCDIGDFKKHCGTGKEVIASYGQGDILSRRWRRSHISIHSIDNFVPQYCFEIVPDDIRARFSVYIPPHSNSSLVETTVIKFLTRKMKRRKTKNYFNIYPSSSMEPWLMDLDDGCYKVVDKAIANIYGRQPEYVLTASPVPVASYFQKILGKDVLLLPISQATANPGGENEKIPIATFIDGVKLATTFIYELGNSFPNKSNNN